MTLNLADSTVQVRSDLSDALAAAWERIGRPGTWWSGEERLAIAAESRHASNCAFCARNREALSPFTEKGDHDRLGTLSPPHVDLIHRVMTDAGRLSPSWYRRTIDAGLSEPAYVETVGVIITVVAVDTFYRGMGLDPPALPDPQPGEPTRELPEGTRKKFSWVPTVSPKLAGEALKKAWWPDGQDAYVPRVHQAMSLVPDEVIAFRRLSEPLYLPTDNLMDFSKSPRAISRAQMELLAGRISALNECFY